MSPARFFDDNPADVDLLGFTAISTAIAATVTNPALNPVVVGLDSPWGGGKSSVLRLIALRLTADPSVIVVQVDPWEFVDSGDPRGTLITRVLDGVSEELEKRAANPDGAADAVSVGLRAVATKLNELRKRIVWSKVVGVAIKSAITLTPDIGAIVDALTPAPRTADGDNASSGMGDFRQDFAKVLTEMPSISRVVVLVDDLDRCLPSDILGALEAIKLFLSVPNMSFVLAAHQDFIRDALDVALAHSQRHTFADKYSEKIIQLPFTLPQLTPADAEAYITLLLLPPESPSDLLNQIVAAATLRRSNGNAPYVVANSVGSQPPAELVALAKSFVRGMPPATFTTPRAIKRFLNNFAIRSEVATAWGATIDPSILMKLWVLEQNHNAEFVALSRLSSASRAQLLRDWESGSATEAVDPLVQTWAGSPPHLSTALPQVEAYFTLASVVLTNFVTSGELSVAEGALLQRLLDELQPIRQAAQQDLIQLNDPRTQTMVEQLAGAVGTPSAEAALDSISAITRALPEHKPAVSEILVGEQVLASIQVEHLSWLADFPDVLDALIALHPADSPIAVAAREEKEAATSGHL